MATAKEIRSGLAQCLKLAIKSEPVDIDRRTRAFAAYASGWFHEDREITAVFDKLLERPGEATPADGA